MKLKLMRTPDNAGICLADGDGVVLPAQASCSILHEPRGRLMTINAIFYAAHADSLTLARGEDVFVEVALDEKARAAGES